MGSAHGPFACSLIHLSGLTVKTLVAFWEVAKWSILIFIIIIINNILMKFYTFQCTFPCVVILIPETDISYIFLNMRKHVQRRGLMTFLRSHIW